MRTFAFVALFALFAMTMANPAEEPKKDLQASPSIGLGYGIGLHGIGLHHGLLHHGLLHHGLYGGYGLGLGYGLGYRRLLGLGYGGIIG